MNDRLTPSELSWLFAQEARSAAQRLRQGVGLAPATEPTIEEGTGGVESTLNRLDDAVTMLASLHGQSTPRGRRGRIDIAALVWEVAPEARVQIEMGEGTTVFGDESEFRRMLHLLLSLSGDAKPVSADVKIRREDDTVRIEFHMGPDSAPLSKAERQWLSRMATRYGGKLSLEGAAQVLTLPADVDDARKEVESLKKELAAAQAQGEAYARELAIVMQQGPVTPVPRSASYHPPSADGLQILVAAARALSAELRGIHAAIGRELPPLKDGASEAEASEIAKRIGQRVTHAKDRISDLSLLGSCPLGELPRAFDLVESIHQVESELAGRARRRDVKLELDVPESSLEVGPCEATSIILRTIIDYGISAAPKGTTVRISLTPTETGIEFAVEDEGATIPQAARDGILSREFEALAKGRPGTISLVTARSVAAHLKLPFEIRDGSRGVKIVVTFPGTG